VLLPTHNLAGTEKRLVKLFKGLGETDQDSLLAFAEFLQQRSTSRTDADSAVLVKLEIPRPDEESVVAAIKRLSATYPMLDRSLLLTETSSQMTAHLMHGKAASMAIDELEAMFNQYYQQYCEAHA